MATAFAILPRKRSSAMKEFSAKVDSLSAELITSIKSQFTRDMDNVKLQIVDSMSPLRNFYKSEEQKLIDSREQIVFIKKKIEDIKESI